MNSLIDFDQEAERRVAELELRLFGPQRHIFHNWMDREKLIEALAYGLKQSRKGGVR